MGQVSADRPTPTVYIDDRAGSADLASMYPLSTCAELCRLDSADAMFTGNGPSGAVLVGIEVKSIYDLLSSLATGRLQATQIPAMVDTYSVNYLAYYGDYRISPRDGSTLEVIGKGGKWTTYLLGNRTAPYTYLENFLFELATLGFGIKHWSSMPQIAAWIHAFASWYARPWEAHRGMHTFDNSRAVASTGMDAATHRRACVASQLPGIGYERAVAAARHFHSIREMVNADAREWAGVEGIGKVIARAVDAALDE